jgi:adenylyl-sulfate kinase
MNVEPISSHDRLHRYGQSGIVVWLTGLPAAGKTTIALELERQLFHRGRHVYGIDGDRLRTGLCADLGFSDADRAENIRRAAFVAAMFADAGLICVVALISPSRRERERARCTIAPNRFVEVYVATPVEICRKRDQKGNYLRADRGDLRSFTGVTAPYEPPFTPEIILHPERDTAEECADQIVSYLGV